MTTLLSESSFSKDAPVNSMTHMPPAVPVGRVVGFATEDSHEEWQNQLRRLHELICELLVENQKLRWALMEMKTLEPKE
jgi:hypothetical protein